MLDIERPEVALRGERGIDIFLRSDDAQGKRARFRCVATLVGAGDAARLIDHEPGARRDPARLMAAALEPASAVGLGQTFALGDTGAWPRAADWPDPLRLFLYLDLFRAWQVADMAWHRLDTLLDRDPAALPTAPGTLVAAFAPLYDFNRLAAGVRAARRAQPVLETRVTAPGWRDAASGGTGYALRMLGDLCLRAGEPALALACFETAVRTGDSRFRRRKCIEAAQAAGNAAARARHLAAYRDRWTLPADLARLTEGGDA